MARSNRKSNVALWIAQSVLAALFLFAGASKFIMPAEVLANGMGLPIEFIRFIGACEILGAFGLVLPGLLRIRTELTPIAAIGLVCIMAGAATISVALIGPSAAIMPAVICAISGAIAYGRRDRLVVKESSNAALRARLALAR